MEKHVHLLGIFFIIYGIMGLIGAGVVFILFVGAGMVSSSAAGDPNLMILTGFFGIMITSIILVTCLPSLIAGWGIIKRKPWSRTLGIIVAIFNIPGMPVGTALGVYALWVLFNDETRTVFEKSQAQTA